MSNSDLDASFEENVSNPNEIEGQFADSDSQKLKLPDKSHPHLAIWGTQGTGKTVYLASLMYAFTASYRDEELPNWKFFPRQGSSRNIDDWVNIYTKMMGTNIFPGATQAGTHYFPSFSLQDDQGNVIFEFTFIDAPGEMYRDPDKYVIDYGLDVHPYDYLRACQGILLLLDPIQAMYGRADEFESVTKMLVALSQNEHGEPSIIDVPIAICITKCDHPECREAFDDAQAFAKQTFGNALIDIIHMYLNRARWFACSALGYDEQASMNMVRRWDGTIGIRDANKIKPHNIAQPIVWLAGEMKDSNVGN